MSVAGTTQTVAAPVDEPARKDDDTKAKETFFREKVLPLLESRCFECHGPESEAKGDLKLSSRAAMLAGGESGAAIVPEKPDESLLIQAVRYEGFEMPPRSRMPDEEIEIFSQWIADGAVLPDGDEPAPAAKPKAAFPMQERIAAHWAWKKIERPAVPEVKQADWPASDTDRFLLSKMEEAGITPAPDADRRVLLRRLYFDLIGLPPTIEQQDRFFNDPAATPVAMEKVVDELLASPQYGERWGRHWLDLVRYAETLGHEFDYPLPYAWRYRDYVIRAINADVPYDKFVREHIAGDLMSEPRRNPELGFNESIIATGFWYLCEDVHAPVDVKGLEATRIDNQIDVFGKTFLGLTIACARCHDHKFDAITADDYYALSGFLQSSRRRVEWIDSHDEASTLLVNLLKSQSDAMVALNEGIASLTPEVMKNLLLESLGESSEDSSAALSDEQKAAFLAVLNDPSSRDLSNPLSLFAVLKQDSGKIPQGTTIQDWLGKRKTTLAEKMASIKVREDSTHDNAPVSTTFARLPDGRPDTWLAFGDALYNYLSYEQRPPYVKTFTSNEFLQQLWGPIDRNRKLYHPGTAHQMKWTSAGITVDEKDAIDSAQLSPGFKGVLQSAEFELTHPEIHILAAGKGTRVRLVIDGYVMNEFSELLFGGCRQPIDTNGEYRWIRLAGDVKRYIGHRCHLEFIDDGEGWFSVREVRLIAQGDEVPAANPQICSTNESMFVSPDFLFSRLIDEWLKVAGRDSAWASLAFKSRLLPPMQMERIADANRHWMELSSVPQPGDPVLVMCEGSGEDEHVFIRGNHNNVGPTAKRHMLTALDGGAELGFDTRGSGRMELVDRVLADSNPFPSRVAVNRVWQHLFGRGIVASSDNFGVLGEAPTHPELLDLLADDFRKDGWSMKRLIKRMVMTRAYRLSSQRNELADQLDPTNKLLHRSSVRRLEAEIIRDEILAISGRLDLAHFGPPVPTYLTSFMEGRGRPGESGPLDGNGRRSIYQSVRRNFLNPFMLAFDTPQPATAISRRSVSNVPAQSLILMNNEFVHQQANVWAKHLMAAGLPDDTAIVTHAYRTAFAREPSESELISLLEFAHADAENSADANKTLQNETTLTSLCHVLLNQKELLFLE